ncbi:MAG: protein phosphatase CheZ [Fibrobacteres bacterium]|nr:protein phosphatase CheZ [Fibrobacterota bacterium]
MNLGLELKGLVENLNALIDTVTAIRGHVDSSIAHIPGAANRLDKITGETESATHHLIDIVDALSDNDAAISKKLDELNKVAVKSADPALSSLADDLFSLFGKSRDEHSRILELLQFQDLTSQQINYVGMLLNKIETELLTISKAFDSDKGAVTSGDKGIAADPNATFIAGGANQSDVDDIIGQFRQVDN